MKLVIFGCGNIAHRIAKGALLAKNTELFGFASRDIDKAKEYADKYSCKHYGNYDDFLNNPEVDAVYVATYNLNHYELIKDCLSHHKSVICEKPMLSSLTENEELFNLAKDNNVTLMEAMKAVFLPINHHVKKMIKDGVIGDIKYIEATFARNGNHDANHWINDLKTGGALKDLGSYCSAIMNFLMDVKPTVTYKNTNASDISDNFAEVCIDYDGVSGHLIASNSITLENCLTISGSKGFIKIPNFWKSGKGYYEVNDERFEIDDEMINDFYYEISHFGYLVDNHILQSDIMSKKASDYILEVTK